MHRHQQHVLQAGRARLRGVDIRRPRRLPCVSVVHRQQQPWGANLGKPAGQGRHVRQRLIDIEHDDAWSRLHVSFSPSSSRAVAGYARALRLPVVGFGVSHGLVQASRDKVLPRRAGIVLAHDRQRTFGLIEDILQIFHAVHALLA